MYVVKDNLICRYMLQEHQVCYQSQLGVLQEHIYGVRNRQDMLLEHQPWRQKQFGMFMEYLKGCQELDGMLQEHQIWC